MVGKVTNQFANQGSAALCAGCCLSSLFGCQVGSCALAGRLPVAAGSSHSCYTKTKTITYTILNCGAAKCASSSYVLWHLTGDDELS
jgi:hypothetical protein